MGRPAQHRAVSHFCPELVPINAHVVIETNTSVPAQMLVMQVTGRSL